MSPKSILGAVLCGGRSSRMGQSKSGLRHPDGGTFRDHALTRIAGLCQEVVACVASNHAGSDSPRFASLPDRFADRGPAEAVAVALQYAARRGHIGCLVTAVDLPALTSGDLQKLIDVFVQHPHAAAVAVQHGSTRLEPLVAVYPVGWMAELDRLASSQDRGLFRFLQQRTLTKIALPATSLRNVNTPDDLQQ